MKSPLDFVLTQQDGGAIRYTINGTELQSRLLLWFLVSCLLFLSDLLYMAHKGVAVGGTHVRGATLSNN